MQKVECVIDANFLYGQSQRTNQQVLINAAAENEYLRAELVHLRVLAFGSSVATLWQVPQLLKKKNQTNKKKEIKAEKQIITL